MKRTMAALLCGLALALPAIPPPAGAASTARTGAAQLAALSIRGADVSTLAKSEAFGGRWHDAWGNRRDALSVLRDNGVTTIRLKVWVNPVDGFNNKSRVLSMARRVKALGMGLLVDFHYSDTWADPGKQYKPAAWTSYNFSRLRQAVYDHTYDVLSGLRWQGTPADLVQVGNEISDGMLWEDGRSSNWGNLSQLLISGTSAVRAVFPAAKIILHLPDGADNGLYRWWFDNATSRGVPFDVIGISYYSYWHGTLDAFRANINDVTARYGKPALVVETAYPFTTWNDDHLSNVIGSSQPYAGYPATPAGQAGMLRAVKDIVAAVPNGRGLGVIYWEPTWTAVRGSGWDPADPNSGNAWENQALFDFNDRPLPALSELGR
jgi:arabinogalactan endo-1,4-beta-galactosidase